MRGFFIIKNIYKIFCFTKSSCIFGIQNNETMKKILFALLLFSSCSSDQDDIQSFKATSTSGGTVLQVNDRFDRSIGCVYEVGDTVQVDEYNWIGGYGKLKGKYLLIQKLESK